LNGFRIIPKEMKSTIERMLQDESYAIVTTALEKLSEAFPSEIPVFLEKVGNEIGHYAQIRIKALEIRSGNGDAWALDSLIDFTGPYHEFWTRRNAINALKRINTFNEKALWNMLDASWNPNSRLASTAVETLQYFAQQTDRKMLMISAKNSKSNWAPWQKKQWEQILR
jgi:aminopeptidase N